MMEYIYSPLIETMKSEEWGVCEEEAKKEFINHTNKFTKEVNEAIDLMSPGQELFKLEPDEYQKLQ